MQLGPIAGILAGTTLGDCRPMDSDIWRKFGMLVIKNNNRQPSDRSRTFTVLCQGNRQLRLYLLRHRAKEDRCFRLDVSVIRHP